MKRNISNSESLTPEQQVVIEAVQNLCDKVRNQDHFSDADIARILSEIKSVHAAYKNAFKDPAFAWQVDNYSVQMALENEYRFIFSNNEKMTWTHNRWKFALITGLAVRYYKHPEDGEGLAISDHSLQLMALWLFFQYFKTNVFTGSQCMEVLVRSFQIVEDADTAISESIRRIRQWRSDNDELIDTINYQKTKWRQETARINRLLNGCMRQKEVELHHIFYWSYSGWSFDQNVRAASIHLGISEKCVKKILRDHGMYETNLWGYLEVYKKEMDAKYEEEVKLAEKVRSKTLTKKEQRSFWRKHSIPNPRLLFRTFTSTEPDLIPTSNPLLTDETCVSPKSDNSAWAAVREGKINGYRSPLQMRPLASCFISMNTNLFKL